MSCVFSFILYLGAALAAAAKMRVFGAFDYVMTFPIENILNLKFSLHFSPEASSYMAIFLASAAAVFAIGNHKTHKSGASFALIVLSALAFAANNILTLYILAEISFLIMIYFLSFKESLASSRMRLVLHLISGMMLAGVTLLSYRSFQAFGNASVTSIALKQIFQINRDTLGHLIIWIIPTLFFVSRVMVSPISWLSRPLLCHFDAKSLTIFQICGLAFGIAWIKNFLYLLLDFEVFSSLDIVGWIMLAIALYQLVLVIGSNTLRELLYSFIGFIIAIYFFAILLHSSQTQSIFMWGASSVFLINALSGVIVQYFEERFGSSSFSVIENSSKYDRSMMRLIIVFIMNLMLIPGSIGFVFMYSVLAIALAANHWMGSLLLLLWVGLVFSMVGKMHRVILNAPSDRVTGSITKKWFAVFSFVIALILLLGFFPKW